MRGPLTLGTAGHIDHGKTALVRALTGKDTDRLPEEHKRGISIELGYAQLALPSGRTLSAVDVPGHERFVRTMVAGATGVDLFLICIAADDGVMPQTREHMAVLRRLGVERGVVAITKSDLIDPAAAMSEAAELVPGAQAVPVAALRGDGLDDLLAALDRVAAETPSRATDDDAPARLHVDRSFTLKGIGTVVTGTLWSGSIAAGDQVQVLPAGQRARVRSVQVHDEAVEQAAAGQRVALNLVGVARDEVGRGDVIVTGTALRPAYLVDAHLQLETDAGKLAPGTRLHVHHGTRESPARVYPLGDCYAQLRLDTPLVAAKGDRVILRQLAPPDTIGGGTVIDPAARRHGASAEVVERLRAIESGDIPADGERAATGDPGAGGSGTPQASRTPGATRTAAAGAPSASGPSASGPGASGPSASGPSASAPSAADAETARGADPAARATADALLGLLRTDGERPRADGELADAARLDAADAAEAWRVLEADGLAVRVARNLHFDRDVLHALTG